MSRFDTRCSVLLGNRHDAQRAIPHTLIFLRELAVPWIESEMPIDNLGLRSIISLINSFCTILLVCGRS